MKIAYISKSIIPSKSANSYQVMKMCVAFTQIGHRVILYCRTSDEYLNKVFAYYGVEKKFQIKKQIFSDIKERKWLYSEGRYRINFQGELPDLFYGRDDYKNLLRVANIGRPVILEVHEPPKDSGTVRDIAKLLSNKNLKYIVATSNALRSEYIKIFPRARDRILVAHNGSSLPVISRDKGDTPWLLGRNTKIKIGYIGHLYPGKGMEIIQQLADRFPDIDFHVIGGTKEDIQYWKGNINNNNIIFYGFIPPGALSKYYKFFDIVLAPYQDKVKTFGGGINDSRWICPLKIFDYMAHSKAIIASDTILKDVLYNRVNCLLCPPEDVEKWQKAILELIGNAELKKHIENNAYKDFIKNYTWTKRAKKVLELLNR